MRKNLFGNVCLAQILFFALSAAGLSAQVNLSLNLPRVLKNASEHTFEVKVKTGGSDAYSAYELIVPPGMEVNAESGQGGTFSLEGQTATFTFSEPLQNSAASLMLTLSSGARGTYTLQQNIIGSSENTDVAMQPYILNVLDEVPEGYVGGGFTTLSASSGNDEVGSLTGDEKRLQDLQTYIDSKQIGEIGEQELEKAIEYYEDATIVLGQAEHITDQEVQDKIVRMANSARKRAEADMKVARNILKAGKKLSKNKGGSSDNNAALNGLIYSVQVGAFREKPARSAFTSLGKVRIVEEDGLHKVLLDNYRSRDEAVKKKETILQKGYDAFIVTYENGVRLR